MHSRKKLCIVNMRDDSESPGQVLTAAIDKSLIQTFLSKQRRITKIKNHPKPIAFFYIV